MAQCKHANGEISFRLASVAAFMVNDGVIDFKSMKQSHPEYDRKGKFCFRCVDCGCRYEDIEIKGNTVLVKESKPDSKDGVAIPEDIWQS